MFSEHPAYRQDIEAMAVLPLPWEILKGVSILISGATGLIGTVLVDVLMERRITYGDDLEICMLGRSKERAKARFQDYMDSGCVRFIPCDVNIGFSCDKAFDYIVHCASNTHPKVYAADPVGTIMTNIIGTKHMLDAAVKSGAKRTLFLSSVEIYGENHGGNMRFSENDCGYIDCGTLRAGYPEGKRAGEALCQAYIRQYGIDVVVPRLCRIFGPTMLESDSKAHAQFVRKAVNREDIVLKSRGEQYYSYCYAGDAVSALFYLLFYGKSGEAYNIADEKSDIRLKDLAELLAKMAGRNVIFELPEADEMEGFSKATLALLDSEKLKGLGWSVKKGIEERMKETLKVLGF